MPFIARPNEAPNSVGIIALPNQSSRDFGGDVPVPPPAGLCNIVTGTPGGGTVGFAGVGVPTFGTCDNIDPDPPNSPDLLRLVQNAAFAWDVRFDATVPQNGWTSLTLTGLVTVVLLSASATYTANNFGQTLWIFSATADCWSGLGSGQNVTATFA